MGLPKLWPDFSDDGQLYTLSHIPAAAKIDKITLLTSRWLGRRYGPSISAQITPAGPLFCS
jgi:hypothetical protein